jgi:hypothetical protein
VRACILYEPRDVRVRALDEGGLHEQKESRAFAGEPLDESSGDKAGKAREKNCLVESHSGV